MQVGHIQLGTDGRMWRVDDEICVMLSQTAAAMCGRSVLDITYPPDRAACRRSMQTLQDTLEPFTVVKRMMAGDGSPLWVSKTVAMATFGDAAAPVLATITRVADPIEAVAPNDLLRQARSLVADLRQRRVWMESSIFVDPPSSILLNTYIAEAQGSLVDVDAMATDAGVATSVLTRWLRAMAAEGLIEEEAGRANADPLGFRLTPRALERCEAYLSHRVHAHIAAIA